MKPFNAIDDDEADQLSMALQRPLSGYLAGKERGGVMVQALEREWAEIFHVKHAVAVNSATSGLLAAAFAVGLGPGDRFACPAMTMTATCAAPMFTGATPDICDVHDSDYALYSFPTTVKAVFVTNLFGMPAHLTDIRRVADRNGIKVIEDNAQSPFAFDGDRYAGTIGHIGVFSLNIHKPIQCGEGGMVVTDDDDLAARLRAFINHGEHVSERIGLNLRMPELCAAIAIAQLRRAQNIIAGRIHQAGRVLGAIGHIPGLLCPMPRSNAGNVFYTIPFQTIGDRHAFVHKLLADGIPVVPGYERPLYRFDAFSRFGKTGDCPIAERLHDRKLFYIENCAYDFDDADIERIGKAFRDNAALL